MKSCVEIYKARTFITGLACPGLKEKEGTKHYVLDVRDFIQTALEDHGYLVAVVTGRPKHLYSIHRKMEKRNIFYDQNF